MRASKLPDQKLSLVVGTKDAPPLSDSAMLNLRGEKPHAFLSKTHILEVYL